MMWCRFRPKKEKAPEECKTRSTKKIVNVRVSDHTHMYIYKNGNCQHKKKVIANNGQK